MTVKRQFSIDFQTDDLSIPKVYPGDHAPGWMTTFLDIMALMLTFFVMLLAMSSPNPDRFKELAGAISSEFSSEERGPGIVLPTDLSIQSDTAAAALPLGYVGQLMVTTMASDPVLRQGRLTPLVDGLVISLPADGIFKVGSADLSEEGKVAMSIFAERLSDMGNRVTLVGHTDQDPYTGERYFSNWTLGLSRAAAVASVFRSMGYNREMRVISQADNRFDELAADLEPAVKRRLARRVDIIVYPDRGRTAPSIGGG